MCPALPQEEFKRLAADFAARELAPYAARWDTDKHFSMDTLRAAAALGFGGVYCREDVGGSALNRADAAVIFEQLAAGDISHTAYLTIHNMVRATWWGVCDACFAFVLLLLFWLQLRDALSPCCGAPAGGTLHRQVRRQQTVQYMLQIITCPA